MGRLIAIGVLALMPLAGQASEEVDRCSAWAQQIVSGPEEACDDLCPQALQFDRYDYRHGYAEALRSPEGLGAFLAYLDRSSIMGSGAELHACAVRSLLEHWGDGTFSAALVRQTCKVREQAIGLIDYTGFPEFQQRYPLTYGLAEHE